MLRRQHRDVVGVVAALLDEAPLAPAPLQRPREVQAAHLTRPPVLAVRVLAAGPHVVVGVVGGVPAPGVDTPQPRPTLPVVRASDGLAVIIHLVNQHLIYSLQSHLFLRQIPNLMFLLS